MHIRWIFTIWHAIGHAHIYEGATHVLSQCHTSEVSVTRPYLAVCNQRVKTPRATCLGMAFAHCFCHAVALCAFAPRSGPPSRPWVEAVQEIPLSHIYVPITARPTFLTEETSSQRAFISVDWAVEFAYAFAAFQSLA